MLLGDTYAATYIKEGDENAKLSPEIKGLITEAYEAVKRSPVFGDWIYGDRINKRLEYLENDDYQALRNAAENEHLMIEKGVLIHPDHYPSCLICHQNGVK